MEIGSFERCSNMEKVANLIGNKIDEYDAFDICPLGVESSFIIIVIYDYGQWRMLCSDGELITLSTCEPNNFVHYRDNLLRREYLAEAVEKIRNLV